MCTLTSATGWISPTVPHSKTFWTPYESAVFNLDAEIKVLSCVTELAIQLYSLLYFANGEYRLVYLLKKNIYLKATPHAPSRCTFMAPQEDRFLRMCGRKIVKKLYIRG